MATVYPGAIDTITNPTSSNTQDSPSHAGQHTTANDAIEAIETTLGVNPHGSYASVATRLAEVDYVEFTSSVSPTATTEATANTVVTGSAVAYDGSTVVDIEFFCQSARPDSGASGRDLKIFLYDGSSSIGEMGRLATPAAGGARSTVFVFRRLTPSAATHTYSIRASVSAGTGVLDAGAGGSGNLMPGYIRITRK